MVPITWLNNLVCIENFLGIHRNYCNQKKIKKHILFFSMFVQFILHTLAVLLEVYVLLIVNLYTRISYLYSFFSISSYLFFILSAVIGLSYSREFMSYHESISRVSEKFENDKFFISSSKKSYWFSIVCILLSLTFAMYRSFYTVKNFDQIDHSIYVYYGVFIFISQVLLRFTILFENLMFFVVITLVVLLSKCLYLKVSAIQESVGSCDIQSGEQCDITTEQIQGWVEMYRDLENCCAKVTLFFGRQFSCSTIMTATYYILLTYQMCYLSFLRILDKKIAIVILSYVAMNVFVIIAAQFVINRGAKFHRVLAQLYNKMVVIDSKEPEVKMIKDFIRLVKKNPLEIKLLPTIPAGMYLLPVILMSTVNYIISMLQLNNVL